LNINKNILIKGVKYYGLTQNTAIETALNTPITHLQCTIQHFPDDSRRLWLPLLVAGNESHCEIGI